MFFRLSPLAMVKTYARKHSMRVVVDRTKKGPAFKSPGVCVAAYLALDRYAHNPHELDAQRACKAAIRIADGCALSEQDLRAAGILCCRGRSMAEVLWSHIAHREGKGHLDDMDGFYKMVVPWTRSTAFSEVLGCASVHSCFKVSAPHSALTADGLTCEIRQLLGVMTRKGFDRGEQLKAAALCSFAASQPVAADMVNRMRRGCSDLSIAIRARSRLCETT